MGSRYSSNPLMVHGVQLALQVYPCLVLRDCFFDVFPVPIPLVCARENAI